MLTHHNQYFPPLINIYTISIFIFTSLAGEGECFSFLPACHFETSAIFIFIYHLFNPAFSSPFSFSFYFHHYSFSLSILFSSLSSFIYFHHVYHLLLLWYNYHHDIIIILYLRARALRAARRRHARARAQKETKDFDAMFIGALLRLFSAPFFTIYAHWIFSCASQPAPRWCRAAKSASSRQRAAAAVKCLSSPFSQPFSSRCQRCRFIDYFSFIIDCATPAPRRRQRRQSALRRRHAAFRRRRRHADLLPPSRRRALRHVFIFHFYFIIIINIFK